MSLPEMLRGAPASKKKTLSLLEPFCPSNIQQELGLRGPAACPLGEQLSWAGVSLPGLLMWTLHWGLGNTFSIMQPAWIS